MSFETKNAHLTNVLDLVLNLIKRFKAYKILRRHLIIIVTIINVLMPAPVIVLHI